MKLEEIKEIKICHSEKEVNEQLKKGFIIKKLMQSKNGENGGGDIIPCFIMAK